MIFQRGDFPVLTDLTKFSLSLFLSLLSDGSNGVSWMELIGISELEEPSYWMTFLAGVEEFFFFFDARCSSSVALRSMD